MGSGLKTFLDAAAEEIKWTLSNVVRINVGDIVILEAGDKIPGDLIFVSGENCKANESSHTGEPDDLTKNAEKDPFFLSGCNLVAGRCEAMCIAVGPESRWGRIKARLVTEPENTPGRRPQA